MIETNETKEVYLEGILSEFRIALLKEIDAASENSSTSAIPLVNGRLIAQIGGSYQYLFDMENALNLPGDTPGDLYVSDRSPIEVAVISIDGMAITLSVPENLGKFVPVAKLQSNLTFLMRKLIVRIESKANIPNPVGDRVLGNFANYKKNETNIDITPGMPPNNLNPEQKAAVLSSLSQDITFIGGPPGTGKTEAIGSIGQEFFKVNRSVLLVSHTNTAVDGALNKIGKFIREQNQQDLEDGKIIRIGVPKAGVINDENLLLSTHVAKRSAILTEKKGELELELTELTAKIKEVSKTLDICEWVIEAQEDIPSMERELNDLNATNKNSEEMRENLRDHELRIDYWNEAVKAAGIAKSHLEKFSRGEEVIKKLGHKKAHVQNNINEVSKKLSNADSLLREVENLGWITRKWRRLPSPEEQSVIVEMLKQEFRVVSSELQEINSRLEKANLKCANIKTMIEDFENKYQAEPKEILISAKDHHDKIGNLQRQINASVKEYGVKFSELRNLFEQRLFILSELRLTQGKSDSFEDMLDAIKNAYDHAVSMIKDVDVEQLRIEKNQLNLRIQTIRSEISEIEESLKKVEELVIKDAVIVATTLTRAYLKDSIQNRCFDTVILDEASMAPIPALWIAASIAEKNAVVVGDWRQLPPIVLSSHPLSEKWLGRDIFEVAGLVNNANEPRLIDLKRQYRMHPSISSIPNALFYQGELIDDDVTKNMDGLADWYHTDWVHDTPVLLVDTSSVGAWVTSVPRGRGSSRLNFLSATICIDIVEQTLRKERDKLQSENEPRILVECPYRPHAQLLELLIHEQNLEDEVRAGTAHTFQGSEADVVIFDLVNDEPHWRVAMFTPMYDDNMKKLLNVALTRARRRLIIVGDFEYIAGKSKKAFLGKELLPFLRRFPKVDALKIIKSGLAARAAKAQSSVLGGDIETAEKRIVVTQEHFFRYLRSDFGHAHFRIIIYSAFMTQNRIAQLEPQLRAAIERGVRIYIVTKPYCDRNKQETPQYRMLEKTLTDWGAIIIHKRGMHEKLVFIDDSILWDGSLNPLSFRDTQEHMERRISEKVFSDYANTLRLDDLIEGYGNGTPKCPICDSEMTASEGLAEPYFWRCTNEECKYTRGIDQPLIEGGIINCQNCGGEVEYGEWGGKPHWRCLKNRSHRQKIYKTHLRLPKMRSIIPKRELRKLDNQFNVSLIDSSREIGREDTQLFLFER